MRGSTKILIGLLFLSLLFYMAQPYLLFAAEGTITKGLLNVEASVSYTDGSTQVLASVVQATSYVKSVSLSVTLHLIVDGTANAISMQSGQLQCLWDGTAKKTVQLEASTFPFTGDRTIGLGSMTVSGDEMKAWDAGQYGVHTLLFYVPSGSRLSVSFQSGIETVVFSSAKSESTVYISGLGVSFESQPPPELAVTFYSEFCQGSLFDLKQIDSSTYTFTPRPDNVLKDSGWYCFAVENVKGKMLTFIENLSSAVFPDGTWMGMPQYAAYSYTDGFSEDWNFVSGVVDSVKHTFTFTLSFTEDKAWIAASYPFPYDKTVSWMQQLDSAYGYVGLESIGKSVQGRDMWLLTITNPSVPVGQKKTVWMIAGQHPTEIRAQMLIKYAADWLVSTDPQAVQMRDRYVFKFVPQANPDGNWLGYARYNAAGVDLNRAWDDASKPPEVAAIYNAVGSWNSQYGVNLFLDLHCDVVSTPYIYCITAWTTYPQESSFINTLQQYVTVNRRDAADYQAGISAREVYRSYGILALLEEHPWWASSWNYQTVQNYALNMLRAIDTYLATT